MHANFSPMVYLSPLLLKAKLVRPRPWLFMHLLVNVTIIHDDHKVFRHKIWNLYSSELVPGDFRCSLNFFTGLRRSCGTLDVTAGTRRFCGSSVEKHWALELWTVSWQPLDVYVCVCLCMCMFQARLYIDGQQFAATRHNPHVVDDWPLHLDQRVHFTKLVVGACWQGPSIVLWLMACLQCVLQHAMVIAL